MVKTYTQAHKHIQYRRRIFSGVFESRLFPTRSSSRVRALRFVLNLAILSKDANKFASNLIEIQQLAMVGIRLKENMNNTNASSGENLTVTRAGQHWL